MFRPETLTGRRHLLIRLKGFRLPGCTYCTSFESLSRCCFCTGMQHLASHSSPPSSSNESESACRGTHCAETSDFENTGIDAADMRNNSLVLPFNPQPRRTDNWLLDLPTEVRHSIYEYLFCDVQSPVWISRHYKLWPTDEVDARDWIFQTQVFRLCRKIHDDAVRFAYGFNVFKVQDDFATFARLGSTALSSIRHLTIVQGAWRAETADEDAAWQIVQQRCLSLEWLEVVLHADMLIPAIPYLGCFLEEAQRCGTSPNIGVDLHVWDRHFSFDFGNRDYIRAQELINGTHVDGPHNPKFISAEKRGMRLPTRAQEIVLTADVTSGTIRALDDYLASSNPGLLRKSSKNLPRKGYRAAGGRSNRYWYRVGSSDP